MRTSAALALLAALAACGTRTEEEKPKALEAPKAAALPFDPAKIVAPEDMQALGLTPHPHFVKTNQVVKVEKFPSGCKIQGTCEEGDLEVEIVAKSDGKQAADWVAEELAAEKGKKEIAEGKGGGRTFAYSIQESAEVGSRGWASEFIRKEGFGTRKIAFPKGSLGVKVMWSQPAAAEGDLPPIRAKAKEWAEKILGRLP